MWVFHYHWVGLLCSQTFTTEERALSNLKNFIINKKGERPFQPLFGTDVPSFLFENITKNLLDNLKGGI